MNTIYIQSYPVYHDLLSDDDFLEIANRDKWMPAITIQRGYPSGLWACGRSSTRTEWQYDTLPPLPVRLFLTDQENGKSRNHTSKELINAALKTDAGLYVLKGVDGGIGLQLAKQVLIPKRIPFAVVIGGEWYHSILKHAIAVFYETEWQKRQLTSRNIRFWRTVLNEDKLIHLPKSVDTRHFSPDQEVEKEFDVIAMGRLISHYKNYEALFELSGQLKVGVIGGGPLLTSFRRKYPEITWFGPVPYSEVPSYLNKGKLFFHSGYRDHYPRTIAEALACGVPPVGFRGIIHDDVIPEGTGLLVSKNEFSREINALLSQKEELEQMSKAARSHAEKYLHHLSTRPAIRDMMSRVFPSRNKGS